MADDDAVTETEVLLEIYNQVRAIRHLLTIVLVIIPIAFLILAVAASATT